MHNSHVIRLFHPTSRLVAIARTVVRLESLTKQNRFRLLKRQDCVILEIQLLDQLEAWERLRCEVSEGAFAETNNILFRRGEWEARALF